MIFDNLKNKELYYKANDKFEEAFSFIDKALNENLVEGKYEIDGKNLYAVISSYTSKAVDVAKFEGHQNYIDIQVVMSGVEKLENIEISDATEKVPYNSEKDVTLYENTDGASTLVAKSGDFAVFFPNDIHKPGMTYGETATEVKKLVVKVRV